MFRAFRIKRPQADLFEIHLCRDRSLMIATVMLLVFVGLSVQLFYEVIDSNGVVSFIKEDPLVALFRIVVAPLVFIPFIAWRFHIFFKGRVFLFDKSKSIVSCNGKEIGLLDEINIVEVASCSGDGGTEYILNIHFKTGKEIEMDRTSDEDEVRRACQELQDFLAS